jgi:hypothetical protein
LISALHESTFEFSRVHIVADRSLFKHLDSAGKDSLRRLERAGGAEVSAFADGRLVELAFGTDRPECGAILVTHDFLDDFRRRFPEIEGADAIGWRPGRDARPVPLGRSFGSRTHQRVSRKEEALELNERRLRRQDVLDRAAADRFRCTSESCLVARLWPDELQELPTYDGRSDSFVCPSCAGPLEVVGTRLAAVQVVVFHGDQEVVRLLVEEGRPVTIGRVDGPGQLGLERHLPADAVAAVSRTHAKLDFDGSDLWVTDCGSKNGTKIGRRGAAPQDRTLVRSSKPSQWRQRDVVYLPEGVYLERSGRRLPLTGELEATEGPPPSDVAPTALVSDSRSRP